MSSQAQSTKMRLLKLLQYSLATQLDTPVSLSKLAQTLNVSRERVRQLYRQLAVEYTLPPVKKRRQGTGRRLRNPNTLAFEAEVRKYNEQGLSTPEIAKRTGRSESTIQRIHHRLHIPLQPRRKSPQVLALEAEARALSEQGLTVIEIAKRTGKPVQTIYHVLRRLGLPFKHAPRRKNPQVLAFEAEVRKYNEQGLSAPEIAGKIGRPRTTVYGVLRKLRLHYKGGEDTGLRNPKTLAFEAEVRWYYFSLGMSCKEIASITGRNRNTVSAALHRLGVPMRKQSRRSG